MGITKITELMTIDGAGKSVVLDGFDFTGNGYVKVLNASGVEIRNCRVYGLNVENAKKNYWLRVDSSSPIKLTVERCYFGANPGVQGALYNFIEPNVVLADGTSISNNYFHKKCCTHNTINLYGAAENANITVSGNVFEESAGTIRIGVKGQPTCEIFMENNIVRRHNTAYGMEDSGLVTVQPYNKQTTSFANMTIQMNGNKLPTEQVIYGYSGSKDTELTDALMPVIYIDGELVSAPIYH